MKQLFKNKNKMNKLVLEKHQEWLEEIETFSNTFLISVAIDHKKENQ